MKKLVFGLLLPAIMTVSSCAQEKTTDKTTEKKVEQKSLIKPNQPAISTEQLQENINEGVYDDFKIKQREDTEEALKILNKTSTVLKYLDENKDKKAKDVLAKLIGEIEILMTKNPALALVPVQVNYEVKDIVVNIQTAQEITKASKKAMNEGYFQLAKKLMDGLTSELIIKTAYLPYATYPKAMQLAAAKLDENKKDEAKAILVQALNTLTIEEVNLPLPILKTEEFIKQASATMDSDKKDKKEIATLFLDNAKYQLKLAEIMGYGKVDKEFKELHEAIKVLKKAIDNDKETTVKFDSLKQKIKKFKERLFFNKK